MVLYLSPSQPCPAYSSWDKDVSAGAQRFRQVFWSRRSDYVLAYLSQYKSKVLRPYYDFSNPDKTYYAQFSKKIEEVLKAAKAELSAASGNESVLSADFTEFRPEKSKDFQTSFACSMDFIGDASYVKEFLDDFERDSVKFHLHPNPPRLGQSHIHKRLAGHR